MSRRPPIVAIMGSVDHGKTTLLDYIRKANVAAREAGGITQSVGAYEIEHKGKKITFVDTPGHEAFSKIKARGAQVADIVILIVASDDSVQPQTKEAIKIILESKTPFIVAINKIDRNPDTGKTKNDLMQAGVLLEGFGGNISNQEISAKTGQGIDELMDLILLAGELENLDYDPNHHASGYVLESKRDNRRGVIATLIVKDGTLKTGDEIAAGKARGKVKILENFLKQKVDSVSPSAPAVVVGFESLPRAGDQFHVGQPKEVEELIKEANKPMTKSADEGTINLILRADVSGSLDALSQVIKNLPQKKGQTIQIVDENVGDVTDGDIKLAISTKSIVVGFKTKSTKPAENLARAHGVRIVQSEIVYELMKAIEATLASLAKKIINGKLEILATFGGKGAKQVIGGEVKEGVISNNAVLEIERNGESLGEGRVVNLQQSKKDVKSVPAGNQCGLIFDAQVEIREGDVLLAH